jgi:hypothetical protein
VHLTIARGCGCGCGCGCSKQTLFGEVCGVRKASGFSVDDSDTCAAVTTAVDSLDFSVIKACAHVAFVLDKDLGKTRSGGTALR